ncbi:hypothetical protein SY88_00895 [Clostridiales bacterium PH28_bin88]|nr:hypothetical protein SY88_00895 [Clostridiales bacterium PH28_bin88]
MAKGNAGSILLVDLSTGSVKQEALSPEIAQQYLGGFGANNRLAYDLIPTGTDPFGKENAIIVGAGTLAGTPAPSSGRLFVTCRMPLNGAIGTGSAGGGLAAQLKWAGYDHLVIKGSAASPVYLLLEDDRVELRDARDLWGKGILETTETLWERLGGRGSVMAIGPAGERLVRFSFALVDNMGTVGRGGLGAVMGAKNLKAVAIRGNKGIELARPKQFVNLCSEIKQKLQELNWREDWLKLGIYLGWPMWKSVGMATKNWREMLPPEHVDRLAPDQYLRFFRQPLACPSCPMADKAVVELAESGVPCRYPISYGLHAALSGARWGAPDEEAALRAMIRANQEGIDDLTLGGMVGFAVDLFQHGLLTTRDTGGVELKHDQSTYHVLAEQIVRREGIGDLLAEGFLEVIRRLGPQAEGLAVHVKGVDPISDPRPHLSGFAFAQMTNPRGAYVVPGNSPAFNPGKSPGSMQKFLLSIGATPEQAAGVTGGPEGVNLARMIKYTEDWFTACSSLGVCARQPVIQTYDPGTAAALYAAATGTDEEPAAILTAGERGWTMYRLLNAREGFTRSHDRLPDIMLQPLLTADGEEIPLMDYQRTRRLDQGDLTAAMDDYYHERGWDLNTGNPTPEKLKELGIPT